MAPKLTPWFPADVKPVRPGVYQIDGPLCWGEYSYFDGVHWNGGWPNPQHADNNRGYFDEIGDEGYAMWLTHWRGLSFPFKG